MSAALQSPPITPENLLVLEQDRIHELVHGRLVEKGMGQESDYVGIRLITLLAIFALPAKLGEVFGPHCGYQAFPHEPTRVRYPDVSFIRTERMPPGGPAPGHCRVAPDLAVEVNSPNDKSSVTTLRVEDYLRAGTRLVWVVDPPTRTVQVFRPDGSAARRTLGQELSGEDAVPGFTCAVDELFRGLATPRQLEPDES
jgi:Uma2 family endonuclease